MSRRRSVQWSALPEELVDEIASRLFSKVELIRTRSLCKTWRSASSIHKRFPKRHNRNRVRALCPYNSSTKPCVLSPAAFFRVFLSSCRNKGWLIKTQDADSETSKKLLHPLSRVPMDSSHQTLDLLKYTVSEIHQSYDVYKYYDSSDILTFARVVLTDNLVFGVNSKKEIWWCNNEESNNNNNNNVWTRVSDEDAEYFSDIIVHKGQVYVMDVNGAIWWFSLSELKIYQYGPSTPVDYYEYDDCKDKRLVEFCGELCIIHRYCKKFRVDEVDVEKTTGFKVYKMDMELVEWVEVKSLGGNAFVMETNSCFSVLARDYYGCLENAIYFTEEMDVKNVNVFKLGDGSVTKSVESSSEGCFQMFNPPFV